MKYKYGCLMYQLHFSWWNKMLCKINREDLHDDGDRTKGLEIEPHVTAIFGLHNDLSKWIAGHKSYFKTLNATISEKPSLFKNSDFEVLKYDVESNWLEHLHYDMREHFDNTQSFPIYHPHVTVAYLRPGTGDKYINRLELSQEQRQVRSSVLSHSYPDTNKLYIDLEN